MKAKRSLVKTYLYSTTLLMVLAILLLGYYLVMSDIRIFKASAKQDIDNYVQSRKEMIKDEVEKVLDYISYKKSRAKEQLRQQVKSRTEEAWQTASYLYQQNKDSKSTEEIKKIIHDALFAVSWDKGKGYYFAEDMQGNEMVNRNNPELEGKNILDIQDSKGNYIVRDIIAVAKSPEREGFCSYYWNKPDAPGVLVPKISYVKYFEPLDWVIGNGKYLLDEEKDIQNELLPYIDSMQRGSDGYVFVLRWDGLSLIEPHRGKNMYDLTDANGMKIVQRLIEVSKKGGGYVSYLMPRLRGSKPVKKISYAKAMPEWQWSIGTGIYTDKIENVIVQKNAELNRNIRRFITKVAIVIGALLLVTYILVRLILQRIEGNFEIFNGFFEQAVNEESLINEEQLNFDEFRRVAEAANRMIEQRRGARQKLAESEFRFHKLIEAAHAPMLVADPDGNVSFVNKEFTAVFGYKCDDIKSVDNWFELAYADGNERNQAKINWLDGIQQDENDNGAAKKQMVNVTCQNGTVRNVEIDLTFVGQLGMMMFVDFTEKIKADKEKEQLEKKLAQAQKMEAIGLMAGGVAHDLNNILSGIVSLPELVMLRLPKDSPLRQPVEAIKNAGKRAADVVADLLTVARGAVSVKQVADLNHIINELMISAEFEKLKKDYLNISFNLDLCEELFNTACSNVHVKKCLMNLLINACEACKGGGQIELSTRNQYMESTLIGDQYLALGEYAVIAVKDSGEGISDNDLEHIFEPFYTKKEMGMSGTGLGLTVVWNTMQDHGGAVTVNNDADGTVFELFFPISREELASSENELDCEDLRGHGEFVLVVDDEAQQRDIATQFLEYLDYCVKAVASGEEAIAFVKQNPVDLLVLDMIMEPGMNGRQAYEQILTFYPGQKAIITSGYSQSRDVTQALAMGADSFIRKPYTIVQLGTAVQKALLKKV